MLNNEAIKPVRDASTQTEMSLPPANQESWSSFFYRKVKAVSYENLFVDLTYPDVRQSIIEGDDRATIIFGLIPVSVTCCCVAFGCYMGHSVGLICCEAATGAICGSEVSHSYYKYVRDEALVIEAKAQNERLRDRGPSHNSLQIIAPVIIHEPSPSYGPPPPTYADAVRDSQSS
ncbi:hypothetical protein PAHA111176_23300 [Parendozoicomonas haliclonae]|uniref:Uncharacterized protein n=1 Tax=Parendozoicomonas haliclonae TaxID=1960125 RepID=A0A1X7AS73_9GAMM|nr:hypothetical protein EHSB41UT_04766 [Parendozoicomonas haliclonae]